VSGGGFDARYGWTIIAGLAATCATAARAVVPVAAAGAHVAFNGYEPLLWLLVVGSLLAALSAWIAHERFATQSGCAWRYK
jgi:hypothetical protein